MGTDEGATVADPERGAPTEPFVRAWWDRWPAGGDPDRPVPWRPNRDDLRYDRRVQLLATGIVVVVVLVGVLGWSLRPAHGSASLPAVPGQATSPAQAGLGYLTALSEADSAGVLAYLERQPPSTELVTDAVLAESARLSPVSDVAVLASSKQTTYDGVVQGTVTMQYQLGPTRVVDTYEVAKSDDGFWRLARSKPADRLTSREKLEYGGVGFVPVDLPEGAAEAGLTLNGVAVSGSTAYLLPGSYQVGSTNPMLTSTQVLHLSGLSGDLLTNEHALQRVEETYDTRGSYRLAALPVELTSSAVEAVAQAAATTAAQCLTEAQLETSCSLVFDPYEYQYAGIPVESTVHWNVESGSLDLAGTRPTTVGGGDAPCSDATGVWAVWRAGGDFRVQGLLTLDTGKTRAYFTYLDGYVVEIADPDHLVVHLVWSNGFVSCLTRAEQS